MFTTTKPTFCEKKINNISKKEEEWNQNYKNAVYHLNKLFNILVVKMDAPGRVHDWLQEIDIYLTNECKFDD